MIQMDGLTIKTDLQMTQHNGMISTMMGMVIIQEVQLLMLAQQFMETPQVEESTVVSMMMETHGQTYRTHFQMTQHNI